MRVIRVKAWFGPHGGDAEVLNRLEFILSNDDGSTRETWELKKASKQGDGTVEHTKTVDQTLVGWEQTLTSSVNGHYKGFWLYLDRNTNDEI